jgi:predicted phosphoribosyltransferase
MVFTRYESRFQAGEILADLIEKEDKKLYKAASENLNKYFSLAIPNGGIPIAEGFCSKLKIGYDMIIVRKIKIPFNTEAGFGSVTTDGTTLINEPLLNNLNLTEKEVNDSIELTKKEIQDRLKLYNKSSNLEANYRQIIEENSIFMIDDGLASGFTMLAAIKMVKKYNPREIFLAVPTSPLSSVRRVKPFVSGIFCPNIKDVWHFAVADAYKYWYDVSESEVQEIIANSIYYLKE